MDPIPAMLTVNIEVFHNRVRQTKPLLFHQIFIIGAVFYIQIVV